jgi:hypothetical protein
MSDKQSKATEQVREHVERAEGALSELRHDGISAVKIAIIAVLLLPGCKKDDVAASCRFEIAKKMESGSHQMV